MASPLVVGGLGGGGDVGLALMMAHSMGVGVDRLVVASFLNCSVREGRLRDLAVEGSLIEVPQGYFASGRVFEDKLARVLPGLEGRVYAICTRDSWGEMVRGLGYLLDSHGPRCMLHADVGGDGVLLGYESRLGGSYETDAVARALLAWASERRGVRSLVASGCVGCEGGAAELDEAELAADLLHLDALGALLGALELPRDAAGLGEALLAHAESGMLPYYLAALRGLREARIDSAYLSGVYKVRPWHRYAFVLDAARHCRASPLCRAAEGRGARGLRGYRPARPPREWRDALALARRAGVEAAFQRLERRRLDPHRLRRRCGL